MDKINKKAFEPLDEEERELMASIDNNEWRSVKNFKKEKEKAELAARNTLRKD
jgi:hypothetical protein